MHTLKSKSLMKYTEEDFKKEEEKERYSMIMD